jgi:hypothetical protein
VRIFVSFASEQEQLAEPVALALRRRGHAVFFSHDDLPPASNFDQRIEKAIEHSDVLVFLISPESVSRGRYTLTELEFARRKWPDPTNHVLPVMLVETALEKVPNYLKGVTILEPAGNTAAETAAAVNGLGNPGWMADGAGKIRESRGFQVGAIAILALLLGSLFWYWEKSSLPDLNLDQPATSAERLPHLNTFFVNVPSGASEEPHQWSRSGDYWLEQIINGRTMRHKIDSRISLNSCNGTVTRKEEDPALQFLIPDIGCPGMTMLFRRDRNPWTVWLPMLKINDGLAETRPARKVTKVCMGEGGGVNCLDGADAKFGCDVYHSWGNGGKMNENLGANFCSITEKGVRKQQPFDIKVFQNNSGGGCGWTGFLVTCDP